MNVARNDALRSAQISLQEECDCCPPVDPEQAAYEAWAEARHETAELEAMRDFLMQHKRAAGRIVMVSGGLGTRTPAIATVATDTFAEWAAWDKRVNWRNREVEA